MGYPESFVHLSRVILCDGPNLCHPKRAGRDPQKKAPRKLKNAVINALHVNCEFGFELRIDYALSIIQRAKDEIGIK